jgi:hypothetical protein
LSCDELHQLLEAEVSLDVSGKPEFQSTVPPVALDR